MNTRRRTTTTGIAALLTAAAVALSVPSPVQAANSMTMLGADVSSLQRSLDLGVKYYDANGSQKHPLDILKGAGMNYARLRVWNNPASGYNNAGKVAAYAKEVKARGLKLMVDLHYSDTWADPGKQFIPAAWANHSLTQLQQDVYNYTYDAVSSIVNGTPSDLKYAKNQAGAPINKNPNYGQPLVFQTPFNGRLGLRLTF